MKFYHVEAAEDDANQRGVWYATLSAAHKDQKGRWPAVFRPTVRIYEVEVPTDKDGVLLLLNGIGEGVKSGRVWTLSSRGGLAEMNT